MWLASRISSAIAQPTRVHFCNEARPSLAALQDFRGGRRTAAAMPDAGGAIAWCLDACAA
jgi:hypothetical protein